MPLNSNLSAADWAAAAKGELAIAVIASQPAKSTIRRGELKRAPHLSRIAADTQGRAGTSFVTRRGPGLVALSPDAARAPRYRAVSRRPRATSVARGVRLCRVSRPARGDHRGGDGRGRLGRAD